MSAERESPGPVVALYIDPRGPYPKLLGPENCWDEQRDARLYEGPHPVVAHPPCGPWGRLRLFCRQDASLGPRAMEQVRRWGGALEHPAYSRLFGHCHAPLPGELPDEYGGRTIEVDQVCWGHVAQKRTWIYLVGVRDVPHDPPRRQPTHVVKRDRRRPKDERKECSPQQRRRTPPAFAEWLVSLARTARGGREAGREELL